jgi:hypothetical protein
VVLEELLLGAAALADDLLELLLELLDLLLDLLGASTTFGGGSS